MVGYWLSPQPDISNGNPYKSIEETSEIIIDGINSSPTRIVKHFNELGYITSSVTYNSAGGTTNETKWEYQEGKYLIKKHERSFANFRGWTEEEVRIEWDSENNLPKRIEVYKNGELWQWATLNPNEEGKIETAMVYNSKGLVYTENIMYLEPSNLIRVRIQRANRSFAGTASYPIDPLKPFSFDSVERKFYPNGDVMVETLTHAVKGDQAYYYEYQYDNDNNWVVKETYQVKLGRNNKIRNKKLENRVTRKITYY